MIDEELERAKKFVERRGNTRKRLYEDMIGHFAPEVVQPETAIAIPSTDAKRYSLSTDGLPHKGAESFAQVEIIECGDFDCPFCARSRKALDETLEAFGGVSLYFAHNPLDYHPGAEPAARAAAAAHEQGKFWEMHDIVFANQDNLEDGDILSYASQIGLDMDKFKASYNARKGKAAVEADKQDGEDAGVDGTPAVFVNGRRSNGRYILFGGELSGWIDDALKR